MSSLYTHEEFAQDMEWSSRLLHYKQELLRMKRHLEEMACSSDEATAGSARRTLQHLITQQYNLDEIAHVARMNGRMLIAKLQCEPETIEHHREACRVKEQSLLDLFAQCFNTLSKRYADITGQNNTNNATLDSRKCG